MSGRERTGRKELLAAFSKDEKKQYAQSHAHGQTHDQSATRPQGAEGTAGGERMGTLAVLGGTRCPHQDVIDPAQVALAVGLAVVRVERVTEADLVVCGQRVERELVPVGAAVLVKVVVKQWIRVTLVDVPAPSDEYG